MTRVKHTPKKWKEKKNVLRLWPVRSKAEAVGYGFFINSVNEYDIDIPNRISENYKADI